MRLSALSMCLVACLGDKGGDETGLVCEEATSSYSEVLDACATFAYAATNKVFNDACDAYWDPRSSDERALAWCIFENTLTQQCVDAAEGTDDPVATAESVTLACAHGGDAATIQEYFATAYGDTLDCTTFIDLSTYEPRIPALALCPCAGTGEYTADTAGQNRECVK